MNNVGERALTDRRGGNNHLSVSYSRVRNGKLCGVAVVKRKE